MVLEVPVAGVFHDAGAQAPGGSQLTIAGGGAADVGVGEFIDVVGALPQRGGELVDGHAGVSRTLQQLGVVRGGRVGLHVVDGVDGDAAMGFLQPGRSAGGDTQEEAGGQQRESLLHFPYPCSFSYGQPRRAAMERSLVSGAHRIRTENDSMATNCDRGGRSADLLRSAPQPFPARKKRRPSRAAL
jgi:hypothetical protein